MHMHKKSSNSEIANAMKISMNFVLIVAIFVVCGVYLDKYLRLAPLFLIICTITGFVTAFLYVIKDRK